MSPDAAPAVDSSSALDALPTPAVVIDDERLERNIERVQASAIERGLRLRPHAKTHKTPRIAARQLAAGAAGLTVATIGEAEAFTDTGVLPQSEPSDFFIAYPLWPDKDKLRRLLALLERARVRVGTDSAEAAARLAPFTAAGGAVSLELDSGHHRSGVLPGRALEVADAARRAGTPIDGLFTFPGHSYGPGAAGLAAREESEALDRAAESLRGSGYELRVLSGGSTPSALEPTTADEIRPGVYVFGDAQQWELERIGTEQIALTVLATVVSRHDSADPALRRVIVDAGSKVLGSDRAAWATGYGRVLERPEARVTALSEHHATIAYPPDVPLPRHGERLRLVPNHVCLTMNLVDVVHTLLPDGSTEPWPVTARGLNG